MSSSSDKRKPEEALLESRAMLQAVLDSLPVAVWIADRDGTVIQTNKAVERVWGKPKPRYTIEEYVEYKGWWADTGEMLKPEDWALARAVLKGETSTGEIINIERFDGTHGTILNNAAPIRDSEGRIIGGVAVAQDITEHRQAEEALSRNEAQLSTVLENMTEGVAVSDMDGRLLYWNRAALQMHGYPSAAEDSLRLLPELLDTFELRELDGTLIPAEEWPLAKVLRGEQLRNWEVRVSRMDQGWERIFNYSGGIARDANGKPLIAVVTLVDITNHKKAEEELRQRAEELEKVMDVVPIAIWVGHDPECRNITGNKRANEFYEAEQGENVSASTTPARRFLQDGRELTAEELPMQYAAVHNTDVRDVEFEVEMPSGNRRILWGYAVPLQHADGQVRGAVGAFVDVTEQRALEAHKLDFYRRTILGATDGKLMISDREDIEAMSCDPLASWDICNLEDLSVMRDEVRELSEGAGLSPERVIHFQAGVVEAATNAIKHAGSGQASLCRHEGSLVYVISDSGPGIGAMALPDIALVKGYSTAGTLGMGYKVMIQFADRVYLATGPEGTTVALEMALQKMNEPTLTGIKNLSGWTD